MGWSIRRAVLVTSSERYVVMVLNFLLIAVASRLLTPSEIGVAALGLSISMLAEAVRDFGTSSYLVRASEITDTNARSAFTVALIISLLLGVVFFAIAPTAAAFYHDPRLVAYLEVLAVSIVFTPLPSTLLALLRRDMQFERAAIVTIGGTAANVAVTIGLIVLGFNYMSFAWAALVQVLASAALAFMMRPHVSIIKPHLGEWRSILVFGSASSAIAVMYRASESLPLLALGRFMPSDVVGLFSRAVTICQLSDKIVLPSVASVALPALADQHRSGHSLKDAFLASISYISVMQWPSLLLLAWFAQPVVAIILGPQWLSAVPLVQIMALAGLFTMPSALPYSVLVSAGKINDMLWAALLALPLGAALAIVASLWGPTALAASQFITIPLHTFVCLVFVRRQIGCAWQEFAQVLVRSALVSMVCVSGAIAAVTLTGSIVPVGFFELLISGVGALVGWFVGVFLFNHPVSNEVRLALHAISRMRLNPIST